MKKITVRLVLSAHLQSDTEVGIDSLCLPHLNPMGVIITWVNVYVRLVQLKFLGRAFAMKDYHYHLFGLQADRWSGLFDQIAHESPEGGDILVLTPVSSTAHATACDPGCSSCTDTCDCVVPVKQAEPRDNGERATCFWCGTPTKRVSQTICICTKCKK